MLSRIWLINVVLGLFVVFLGFKAYGVWLQGNRGFDIPQMAGKPAQGVPASAETLHKRNLPPESTYERLMTLNLFAPERTEILPEAAKVDAKSKKLNAADKKKIEQNFKNLTLYGLVITNDIAEALVSHPVAKSIVKGRKATIPKNRSRNIKRLTAKETKWVKAGDQLGDFKVVSIKPDRVLLKSGDQSYDLLLYDKDKLKKHQAVKPKTGPNVVGVTVPKTASKKTGAPTQPKTASKASGASAKSPVVFKRGDTSIPLPTKKRGSGAPVQKPK